MYANFIRAFYNFFKKQFLTFHKPIIVWTTLLYIKNQIYNFLQTNSCVNQPPVHNKANFLNINFITLNVSLQHKHVQNTLYM